MLQRSEFHGEPWTKLSQSYSLLVFEFISEEHEEKQTYNQNIPQREETQLP